MENKERGTNRLGLLRRQMGITQAQLAKDLGVSRATIQNWEKGITDITGYSLMMLCDRFNVSPNEVYGTGSPSPYWEQKKELLFIFDSVNEAGKKALVAMARGIESSYQPKNNPLSEKGLMGETA